MQRSVHVSIRLRGVNSFLHQAAQAMARLTSNLAWVRLFMQKLQQHAVPPDHSLAVASSRSEPQFCATLIRQLRRSPGLPSLLAGFRGHEP